MQYPDYETILSADAAAVPMIVARAELLAVLERHTADNVRLAFGVGRLTVVADDEMHTLPGTYAGAPLELTLNAAFVGDAVRAAVGPDLIIEATTPVGPVVFRSADDGTFTTMLMPIRTE
jgi:DNA polymerase III sliding clamp (beta) subunit (PCNA family)